MEVKLCYKAQHGERLSNRSREGDDAFHQHHCHQEGQQIGLLQDHLRAEANIC